MGFKDLTNTQITVFILGVVFSLLAVAAIFWAFKHSKNIKSKVRIILYTMILPFIAITSWLILIFSFVDGFKQDDVLNIFVSLALALVICFMILTIAYVLYQKNKDKFNEEVTTEVPVDTEETSVVDTEEIPVETQEEVEPKEDNEVVIEEPEQTTDKKDEE